MSRTGRPETADDPPVAHAGAEGADLVDRLFNSSEKRLARTRLLLARYGEMRKPGWVLPKISQEALAEMVGTTRSRVNVFMNKFKKLGFVEYNGDFKINSSRVTVIVHSSCCAEVVAAPATLQACQHGTAIALDSTRIANANCTIVSELPHCWPG